MSNVTKSLDKSLENVSTASDRTHSSAVPIAPSAIIYMPSGTHKSYMKNVSTERPKNNDKSIVERLVAEQTSDGYSTRSVISRDGHQSGRELSSEDGSLFNSASIIGFQSKELPSNPISPSAQRVPNSDDGPFNITSRKPTTGFKDYRSFDSSQSFSNDKNYTSIFETEPFYPVRASTNSLHTSHMYRVLNLE